MPTNTASNYVHVCQPCDKCNGCVLECEHQVKTTLTTNDTTEPDWLDQILSNLALGLSLLKNKADIDDTVTKGKYLADVGNELTAAKSLILAELGRQKAEARIDELEKVKKYAGAWFRGNTRIIDWVNMEVINDRLAQLQSTKKGKETV